MSGHDDGQPKKKRKSAGTLTFTTPCIWSNVQILSSTNISFTVARLVYVPANGNKENATFPIGQDVSRTFCGTIDGMEELVVDDAADAM